MSDDYDYRSLSAANYWAHKANTERENALLKDNKNTIASIADAHKIHQLIKDNKQLEVDNEFCLDHISKQAEEIQKIKNENEFYKNLLSKPMAEIAKVNSNFKAAYDKQQELTASWMVSQKAFKELAIDLGLELGKTKEEIVNLGLKDNTKKVLNNETNHNNNAIDFPAIQPHIDNLKKILIK